MSLVFRLVAWLAAAAFAAGPAHSQTFPSRSITIVVPYPAGGPTDAAARFVGQHMAATLGQNVVIENVSGGGANIGSARVARATPDGHTLLLHNLNIASNVSLYTNLPFDTEKDLIGLALVNYQPFVVVGRKDLPANSMAELAAWMKQNGPKVKFGHVGAGSLPHLIGAMLAKSVGVEFNMIPYRGATPALIDLVAGHADVYVRTPASSGELIRTGQIKGYVVTAKERVAALPNVPSAIELGYKDLDILFWQAVFVPAATPKAVMARLNEALQLALADPKVRKSFEDTGSSVYSKHEQTPEATATLLRSEIKRWGEVIRANKITLSQ